jgi:phosphoenolpyruvate-protein kinase (PTS system EI component)
MIETPAALFALEEILELADFVSIGTNDLTQYMLATDRGAADSADDCTPWHPAVLRAIKRVVDAAAAKNCPVCVCGEEAGEAEFACLLVGLGVRELSMTPVRAASVRHALRKMDCPTVQELANKALRCVTPNQVRRLLTQLRLTGKVQ